MTELTFTKDTDGFYTSAFRANGRCHVQINKDVSDDAGVTVFEAAVDGEDYVVFQPTYDSSGILAEIDLPSGFNVRIKSTTQVQYASVIGDAEYIPFIDPTWLYFTMPQGGTVTLTKNGTPTEVTLEYSLDNGSTWTTWVESENVRSLTLAAGQTMHVRNTSETSTEFSTSQNSYYNFAFSSDVYAGGNTDSLLCKVPSNAIITSYCFINLFKNAETLITTPLLPSITIAANCYRSTFYGCTLLTLSDNFTLPATTLATYCYNSMFQGCTSLTMSNTFTLPSTTLAAYCYSNMFSGCTNLTMGGAFTLPATTLDPGCYYGMFYGCTSLTMNDTFTLPATTLVSACYYTMFFNCPSLDKVKTAMTDISAQSCITYWLNNVSPTGDFYCPAELTIPTGASGIPSGWIRHDI